MSIAPAKATLASAYGWHAALGLHYSVEARMGEEGMFAT
jgi:hypothetical protein